MNDTTAAGRPLRVAILGAGRMGCGIAHVFAEAGHEVNLFDANADNLDSASQTVSAISRLLDCVDDVSARVTSVRDLARAVAATDLVIEAVTENLAIKRALFAEVSRLVDARCMLATNTSAIPIAQIGSAVVAPARFLGMHFWNPPHLVPLVEVVQSETTDPSIVESAMRLLSAIGMSPVHVRRDIPGFIGNRLQHALKREAIALVADGVCDAETLDQVVKTGFGSRLGVLGPLEQSDMVGLDMTLAIHDTLLADLDCSARAHPYLRDKVAHGHTGMKQGSGFRAWTPEQIAQTRQRFETHLLGEARRRRSGATRQD